MTGLGEVVRALAAREGVDAVVLVSADGLPIQHAGRFQTDTDAVAALTAGFARQAVALSEALGHGAVDTAVLEAGERLVVVARLGASEWLLVLPADGAAAGPLLYDLRRHRPALTALL